MLLGQELMKVCHWPRINESMPLCIDKKIMMLRYGYQIIQAQGYNCDFLSLGERYGYSIHHLLQFY